MKIINLKKASLSQTSFNWFFIPFFLFLIIISPMNAQLTQDQVDSFFKKFMADDRSHVAELFSKQFLSKVPEAQLVGILDKFKNDYGSFERAILKDGSKLEVLYEKASMPGLLGFDSEGKVVTLWFGLPVMKVDSFEKIKGELEKLSGTSSCCIRKNGQEIFSLNKTKPLGIGSAFKLFVLKTLINEINSGKVSWDNIIRLDSKLKSLPS
jgi:hypothetical protein